MSQIKPHDEAALDRGYASHKQLCADMSSETNIAELKALAQQLNIPTTGNKADLCSRIVGALDDIYAFNVRDAEYYD